MDASAPSARRPARRLHDDEPVAPFPSSTLQHQAPAARAHAREESVAASSLEVGGWPEMFFHWEVCCIIGEECAAVKPASKKSLLDKRCPCYNPAVPQCA